MDNNFSLKFSKLLLKSNHILVILPENPNIDFLSSGLALAHFCNDKKINVTLAYIDYRENDKCLNFLKKPKDTQVVQSISGSRDLVLVFKTKYNNIIKTKNERLKNEFKIYITPEKGIIDPRDLSFAPAKFPYDLIFTIGLEDKEKAGKINEEMPDLFYEVPIINIDNSSENTNFGQFNLVKITASSTSEILSEILKEIDEKNISKECANYLLTGIISSTHSFQKQNTTPKCMNLASFLIEKGAEQQKIVHNLYRSQPLDLIKLWGKAMSNLNKDTKGNLIWTILTKKEIGNSQINDFYKVLAKIKQNYSSGKIYVLIYENDKNSFNTIIDAEKIGGLSEEIFGKPTFKNIYNVKLNVNNKEKACNFINKNIKIF